MSYKEQLEKIKGETDNTFTQYVIDTWLDSVDDNEDDDEVRVWVENLRQGGCQSGHVGGLIYTVDVEMIYVEHIEGIEALIDEWEEKTGVDFFESYRERKEEFPDRRVFTVWAIFEETAFDLAREVGIEL